MSESRRMIKKIKEGKIWEAFEDVNYYNSLKYLDEKEGKFFKNLWCLWIVFVKTGWKYFNYWLKDIFN